MAFREGRIASAKEFRGNAFPKTLFPASESGRKALPELVAAERERLAEDLRRHGAVLLRGFDLRSAEDFSQVVEAFGWEEVNYSGGSYRVKLADRVITTNITDTLNCFIPFHHEMALMKDFPNKIFFFCSEASPEGGETSIIRSDFMVEKMEEKVPDSMRKMEEDGIVFTLHSKAWQKMFDAQDQIETEKMVMSKSICNTVKFNDNGIADFTYGPMSPVKEFDGKRVMWLVIDDVKLGERSSKVSYGDGSPLPEEAIRAYHEAIAEGCVDVKWEQGDVLILDNLTVQHARRPGKPPRIVLASLTR